MIEQKKITLMTNLPSDFTERYIFWGTTGKDDDIKYAIVYILVGYCPNTLSYFAGLFADVKKEFPEAEEQYAICSKIKESLTKRNFTFLRVMIYNIEKRTVSSKYKEILDSKFLDIRSYFTYYFSR